MDIKARVVAAVLAENFKTVKKLINRRKFSINDIFERKTWESMTLLHYAIKERLLVMAHFLLKHGADGSIMGEDAHGKFNCLHLAARNNDDDMVLMLLKRGIDINEKMDSFPRQTALHIAVNMHDTQVMKILLEHKADVNIVNDEGSCPMSLISSVNGKTIGMIRLLLKHGANANCVRDNGTMMFREKFVLKNRKVRNLFLRHGADVFAKDYYGRSIIFDALLYCESEYIQKLLKMGVAANETDNNGETPLHYLLSVWNEEPDEVIIKKMKLLIDYGADVNAYDSFKETPLYLAAGRKSVKIVKLLLENGAIIDQEDFLTPLHAAFMFDRIDVIQCLISNGARLDTKIADEQTLFNLAITCHTRSRENDCQIVQLLLENGMRLGHEDDYVDLSAAESNLLCDYYKKYNLIKINDKICHFSNIGYFDLLMKRGNELVRYLRKNYIRKIIESGEYKKLFPLFSTRFEVNFAAGFKRMQMINDAAEILYPPCSAHLPLEMIFKIVENFNEDELETILA